MGSSRNSAPVQIPCVRLLYKPPLVYPNLNIPHIDLYVVKNTYIYVLIYLYMYTDTYIYMHIHTYIQTYACITTPLTPQPRLAGIVPQSPLRIPSFVASATWLRRGERCNPFPLTDTKHPQTPTKKYSPKMYALLYYM